MASAAAGSGGGSGMSAAGGGGSGLAGGGSSSGGKGDGNGGDAWGTTTENAADIARKIAENNRGAGTRDVCADWLRLRCACAPCASLMDATTPLVVARQLQSPCTCMSARVGKTHHASGCSIAPGYLLICYKSLTPLRPWKNAWCPAAWHCRL